MATYTDWGQILYGEWRQLSPFSLCCHSVRIPFIAMLKKLRLMKITNVATSGGNAHVDGRGTKVRGECHLLMVGDPG